ncbi:MAG: HAD family phosphatase [Rhodobacterales bacterium]|nr:HAD family phosphatase [Rhodobacterales bacterium]MDX5389058.1 HAD family phosphatase [Rhodobacterales bacterium]MDX5488747.1 HAD family phosphatase [Rhodobacterales bacterium]
MTVQAVIFDIGNVLIEWQPERFYDATIGEGRRRAMFADVDLHAMNDRVDSGGNFADEIARTARDFPDHAEAIMMWHSHWLDMARPEIPHSVRLLRALRARAVPVFALSNFGLEPFGMARGVYPFLDEFDRLFLSGAMGVTKPAPRIYQMLEEGCGLPPAALLFADDRAENIEAAAARGWQTHLFDGPEGWAKRLVAEGLLTEKEAA